jgi:hypothetical protein
VFTPFRQLSYFVLLLSFSTGFVPHLSFLAGFLVASLFCHFTTFFVRCLDLDSVALFRPPAPLALQLPLPQQKEGGERGGMEFSGVFEQLASRTVRELLGNNSSLKSFKFLA